MKKNVKIILQVLLVIAITLFSYYIGYIRAINNNNLVNKKYFQKIDTTGILGDEEEYCTTFYASIIERKNNGFLVKGLDVNESFYRGEFTFDIQSETKIRLHNDEVDMSELKVGDNISITFIGPIENSSPATINNIIEIKVLV